MNIETTHEQPPSKNPNRRVWWIVGAGCALALCFGLILGGVGLYVAYKTFLSPATATAQVKSNLRLTPVTYHLHPRPSGASLGNPNAQVKMIIYSDFQCPYCMIFWRDTEEQIFRNYVSDGKVYVTYRSMGEFLGTESQKSAEAAYCAGDQEKFWEYHDALFSNQGAENSDAFSDAHLEAFAQSINLDMTVFDACFSRGKYTERVKKDKVDAFAAGIKSSPTVLINGQMVQGAQPYEVFKQAIDAALAKQ